MSDEGATPAAIDCSDLDFLRRVLPDVDPSEWVQHELAGIGVLYVNCECAGVTWRVVRDADGAYRITFNDGWYKHVGFTYDVEELDVLAAAFRECSALVHHRVDAAEEARANTPAQERVVKRRDT